MAFHSLLSTLTLLCSNKGGRLVHWLSSEFVRMKLKTMSACLQPCRWSTVTGHPGRMSWNETLKEVIYWILRILTSFCLGFGDFLGKQTKASWKLFTAFYGIVYSCVNISSPWVPPTLQLPLLETAEQKNCLFHFLSCCLSHPLKPLISSSKMCLSHIIQNQSLPVGMLLNDMCHQ